MSKKVSFDYGKSEAGFMDAVKRVLVQEPGYKGCGGHGVEDTPPHGSHSQVSIGIDNQTVNFRQLTDDQNR